MFQPKNLQWKVTSTTRKSHWEYQKLYDNNYEWSSWIHIQFLFMNFQCRWGLLSVSTFDHVFIKLLSCWLFVFNLITIKFYRLYKCNSWITPKNKLVISLPFLKKWFHSFTVKWKSCHCERNEIEPIILVKWSELLRHITRDFHYT